MPKLKIEYRKPSEISPYANNSRTHSDQQVQQIAASITEFGFSNPILISNADEIIAGHGRLQAAEQLGLAEVPTIKLGQLTDEQRRAYVIADNQIALNAGWDLQLLQKEVDALLQAGFDTELLALPDLLLDPAEGLADLGLTPEEKLDNFLNGDTKILRLAYSEDELGEIVHYLDAGLAATGTEDYSTLVFNLVKGAAAQW